MGFPKGYSTACYPKGEQKTQAWQDERLTLIGNSWNVFVVAWLLNQLSGVLGLGPFLSLSQVVEQCSPGGGRGLQCFLLRPFMRAPRRAPVQGDETGLAQKLAGMASLKGEDILLSGITAFGRVFLPTFGAGEPFAVGDGMDNRNVSIVWSYELCTPPCAGAQERKDGYKAGLCISLILWCACVA